MRASAREHEAASVRASEADRRVNGETSGDYDLGWMDRRKKENRVPANKKRAAMHSLYSLDINTRQRARNQPRLHRQLLPNDTDTHTRSLIVIKQKMEQKEGRERRG